jgi:hypothetical protein
MRRANIIDSAEFRFAQSYSMELSWQNDVSAACLAVRPGFGPICVYLWISVCICVLTFLRPQPRRRSFVWVPDSARIQHRYTQISTDKHRCDGGSETARVTTSTQYHWSVSRTTLRLLRAQRSNLVVSAHLTCASNRRSLRCARDDRRHVSRSNNSGYWSDGGLRCPGTPVIHASPGGNVVRTVLTSVAVRHAA